MVRAAEISGWHVRSRVEVKRCAERETDCGRVATMYGCGSLGKPEPWCLRAKHRHGRQRRRAQASPSFSAPSISVVERLWFSYSGKLCQGSKLMCGDWHCRVQEETGPRLPGHRTHLI